MNWIDRILDQLTSAGAWGYHPNERSATEPAALAGLALLAHGRSEAAARPLKWLVEVRNSDGSLGVTESQRTPGWPTAWAVIAWRVSRQNEARHDGESSAAETDAFAEPIGQGVAWLMNVRGSRIERTDTLEHDSTIIGWPWVEGTHSWIEPTAMALLALAVGDSDHVRARDAVRLLRDRLLSTGGCNYGNTAVFHQELRPQVEPTGLTLLALKGEADPTGRVRKSIEYLEQELSARTTPVSLSYGLLGLAAHDRWPQTADHWLEMASKQTLSRNPGAYPLALLALASLGTRSPLLPRSHRVVAT